MEARISGWTAEHMPELTGRTALVTGANSGLGLATAQALAVKGAHVVLACRGRAKADAAMAQIRASVADARLDYLELDLADLASIRAAAQRFNNEFEALHILCNNAGVMGVPLATTADGFETVFGVNHLGHFTFTGLLMETIRATPGARVVTVSSRLHHNASLPFDDLHWRDRAYNKTDAYGQAKLANLTFALELDRRLRAAGIDAISVAAHPGYSASNIAHSKEDSAGSWNRIWNLLVAIGNATVAQSAANGALPTLYAASAPDVAGGEFFGPHGWFEFRGHPVRVAASAEAENKDIAARLWQASEELTGVQWL